MRKKEDISMTQAYNNNREMIPIPIFHIMSFIMKLMDLLCDLSNKNFRLLGLQKGQVVIDYGCGPARYIKNASMAVGTKGKVIATDIHPLAIKKVEQKIQEYGLSNVQAVLCNGYDSPIDNEIADVIYALDVFHMIKDSQAFLTELTRLAKKDGEIIIADGHQSRTSTLRKIENSKLLEVIRQNKWHVVCRKYS